MFKGRHFDRSVLLCVRWYLAYGLSLRDLKEMMAERGISIDHSTIHRWVVYFAPLLLQRFNRRKRALTGVVMSGRRPLIKGISLARRGSWERSCLRPFGALF
jgi:transposase-like protein